MLVDATLKKLINSEIAFDTLLRKGIELVVSLSCRIVLAILAFLVCRWIIRKLKSLFSLMLERRNIEPTLSIFLNSLVNIVLNFILIIIIIGILGIETSSLVALFASAGVAIGMALSGTLQNFAGGVMILLFKPFKAGDFIETQSFTGTVKEIQIFNTLINTTDNKVVIIPNGGLSTSIVTNFSKETNRRVDWKFSIAYGDDFDKARNIILDIIKDDQRILSDKEPFVALGELSSSSVDIVVRAWVKSENYWSVYFSMNEKIYKALPEAGLSIPFQQMDVYLHQEKNA